MYRQRPRDDSISGGEVLALGNVNPRLEYAPMAVPVNDNYRGGYVSGNQQVSHGTTRSDSDLARALQEQELCAMRTSQEQQSMLSSEDAQLASEMQRLESQRAPQEARQQLRATKSIKGEDFMRPKNYKPIVCSLFLATCIAMIVVEIWKNGWALEPASVNPMFGPKPSVMVDLGAKVTDRMLNGELYRFFTPMVLHAGIIHMAFNMFGLLQVGFPAEREFGHFKIGSIIVLSGFVGVLMSCLFIPEVIGVGASGAIFGLLGACWADLIQNWSLYRNQACCTLLQLLVSTGINLLPGFTPFVDNFAHLGGFFTGFVLGVLLLVQTRYSSTGRRKARRDYQVVLQGIALLVLPVVIGTGLLIFFLKIDANEWCSFCHHISCIPMPPGAKDADRWWDCSQCNSAADTLVYEIDSNTWMVQCPKVLGGANVTFPALDETLDSGDVIPVCKAHCG